MGLRFSYDDETICKMHRKTLKKQKSNNHNARLGMLLWRIDNDIETWSSQKNCVARYWWILRLWFFPPISLLLLPIFPCLCVCGWWPNWNFYYKKYAWEKDQAQIKRWTFGSTMLSIFLQILLWCAISQIWFWKNSAFFHLGQQKIIRFS